ncbi:MAG: hypothetical protein M3O50_09200 [Myxococcota bacterium]|nr:hypothetical protein [Myxococcota bacterium]
MNLLHSAQGVVPSACENLLLSIGHRAKKHTRFDTAPLIASPQDFAAGIIDFSGEALSGSVVLLSAFKFFAASLSSETKSPLRVQSAADWIRVRDVSMELTNQLLGRIKNQLCKYGIVVEPSLPRAVSGYPLRVTVRERTVAPHVYIGEGCEVFVWFEAVVKDASASPPPLERIAEGDLVEF